MKMRNVCNSRGLSKANQKAWKINLFGIFMAAYVFAPSMTFAESLKHRIRFEAAGSVDDNMRASQMEVTAEAFAAVPACLRDSGTKPADVIIVSGPEYSKRLDGVPNDSFGGQYLWNEITIPSGVFADFLDHSAALFEQRRDLVEGTIKRNYSDLERILFHESVHHYHLSDPGHQLDVDNFLALRADKARKDYAFNEKLRSESSALYRLHINLAMKKQEVKTLEDGIRSLKRSLDAGRPQNMGQDISQKAANLMIMGRKNKLAKLNAEIPVLEKQYQEKDSKFYQHRMDAYKQLGLPSRFDGDMHSAEVFKQFDFKDPMGAEYFAMAVEMMVYDHAAFCRTFSTDEIKVLTEMMGDCLSVDKVPRCQ